MKPTSLDLIAEYKKGADRSIVGMLDTLQARIVNESEVTQHLLSCVRLIACTCRRTFLYHGVGVAMCRRCSTLVLYEELTEGKSETQRLFDAKFL